MSAPSLQAYANGTGEVSGDNLNTFAQTCNNVTDLRGFVGVPGTQVYMRGYATANDGGQGQFYWNAAGTGPDDAGVTNIVPNGATTGCWTRLTVVTSSSSIANNLILSNISGGPAAPVGNTITALLDALLGSTAGDIALRGASSWGVLAAGSAGTVITANGAGTAPSYQAVPGGAGSLVLLSTQVISSPVAAVDFTTGIDSTYSEYAFRLTNVRPATNSVSLYMRVSTDGGANFQATGYDYVLNTSTNDVATFAGTVASNTTQIAINGVGSSLSTAAGSGLDVWIRMHNPSQTTQSKRFDIAGSCYAAGIVGPLQTTIGPANWRTVTAINAIRFFMNSGNVDSGIFKLYGVT